MVYLAFFLAGFFIPLVHLIAALVAVKFFLDD